MCLYWLKSATAVLSEASRIVEVPDGRNESAFSHFSVAIPMIFGTEQDEDKN